MLRVFFRWHCALFLHIALLNNPALVHYWRLKLHIHNHLGHKFWCTQIKRVSDARWSYHKNNIFEKACPRLNLLRMLKHVLDRNVLIRIYFALIWPILEYGSIVLDNCSHGNSHLLENVQKKACTIITGLLKSYSKNSL